jgi:hypothetical protein
MNRKESEPDPHFADSFFHSLPHSDVQIKFFEISSFQNPETYKETVEKFAESMNLRSYAVLRVPEECVQVFLL